jgi:flavodoxin
MKPCVLYFSRTGNTKQMAEAISELIKAPLFSIASCEPSVVEDFDLVFLGTPVEGASPAKETQAFIERLPNVEGKKAIVFCTYRMFGNERTMKKIQKKLANKGYENILRVSRKMKSDQPADFSDSLNKIKQALEK